MAYIISGAVSANKLVDEPPNQLARSVLRSVRTNTPIIDGIKDVILNGFHGKAEQYYKYGNPVSSRSTTVHSEDDTVERSIINRKGDEVKIILDSLQGTSVTIKSLTIGDIDYFDLAMSYLTTENPVGWRPITQEYRSGSVSFFLEEAYYPNEQSTLQLNFKSDKKQNEIFQLQTPQWAHISSNIPFMSNDTVVYTTKYKKDNDPYEREYTWIYVYYPADPLDGSPYYSTLSDLGGLEVTANKYFPITPLRRGKVNSVDDHPITERNTRKHLRTLGLDLGELTDILTDPDDPTNLDNVNDIFTMFAVDMDSTNKYAIAYMYEHFKAMYYFSRVHQARYIDWINAGSNGKVPINRRVINAAGVNFKLEYNFITLRVLSGLITDVGLSVPLITDSIPYNGNTNLDTTIKVKDITLQKIKGSRFTDTDDDPYNTDRLIYRKQLTSIAKGDVNDTYIELMVGGLQTVNDVYAGDQGAILRDQDTMDDGGFFIPISYDVISRFNGLDKSNIYYETLQLIIYAYEKIKLKWYQTTTFKVVLIIAAIVITIISQGSAGSTFNKLIAAGYSTAAAVAIIIASSLLFSIALRKFSAIASKEFGSDVGAILTFIVAILYIAKGDVTKLFENMDAAALMNITSVAFTTLNLRTLHQYSLLTAEAKEFEEEFEKKEEELEKVKALLGSDTGINIYDLGMDIYGDSLYTDTRQQMENFTSIDNYTYLKSEGLFDTIELSLNSPENFVDMALELPEFNYTE